jgi:hypothetical protein
MSGGGAEGRGAGEREKRRELGERRKGERQRVEGEGFRGSGLDWRVWGLKYVGYLHQRASGLRYARPVVTRGHDPQALQVVMDDESVL